MESIEIVDGSVTLMVRDLDRSQSFYTEVLGFRLLYRAGAHFCMVEGPGLKLGLHPKGPNPTAGEAPGGISIGLKVPDLAGAVAALQAGGVEFPDGVVDDDGAILRADFADPDGTPLYLFELRT